LLFSASALQANVFSLPRAARGVWASETLTATAIGRALVTDITESHNGTAITQAWFPFVGSFVVEVPEPSTPLLFVALGLGVWALARKLPSKKGP
jgi:PEP-CTERM motif